MKSVLSIQSHVVHGYVGGRAAIFPLQTQGWEVDNINTVHFSNHTGYGHFRGQTLDRNELALILDQLINQLQIDYNAVITGYVPNAELILCIREYITTMKREEKQGREYQKNGHESNGGGTLLDVSVNSPMTYLMDPVMGDNNYMYVDQSCVDEYRKLARSDIVDIITPNQFELELLVNNKITNRESLQKAILQLHDDCGIPYVVITSVEAQVLNSNLDKEEGDYIYCVISIKTHLSSDVQMRMFQIPTIKSYFTGVGDLFSALLLDKFTSNKVGGSSGASDNLSRLSRSVNQVLTIMAKTLKLTHKLGMQQARSTLLNNDTNKRNGGDRNGTINASDLFDHKEDEIVGKINDGETMKYFELKVIQAKDFYKYNGDGEFKEMKF